MSVYANNHYVEERLNDAWHKLFGFIPEGSRVLDVGCSSGHLGEELRKQKKAYVVGIDINKEDINEAKKILDEAYVVDLENDDLKKLGSFDYIIMADVIEHLVDPVSVLIKLKELFKDKGEFVFSIPNMANVTTRIELLKGRFEYKDFGVLDRTHLHFYDYNEVERVFNDAGYTVKKTDCTIRTIPEDILRKDLASIGLEYSEHFEKMVHDNNGFVFQFIGIAVPKKGTKRGFKVQTTSPLDSISVEIDLIRNSLQSRIDLSEKSLSDERKRITTLESKIEGLKAELSSSLNELKLIKESKGWKALEKARKIKKLLPPTK